MNWHSKRRKRTDKDKDKEKAKEKAKEKEKERENIQADTRKSAFAALRSGWAGECFSLSSSEGEEGTSFLGFAVPLHTGGGRRV